MKLCIITLNTAPTEAVTEQLKFQEFRVTSLLVHYRIVLLKHSIRDILSEDIIS
jgi:hypothetical protein